ncbi:hypothetical protein V501_00389 [Pseudogymnoascus sp. VKM F-4519 (FW-2642)]|nr:hypothetical protein V501_00389 [Pseudogymnoascus sp. VKM F-4519 (FW-2642)]
MPSRAQLHPVRRPLVPTLSNISGAASTALSAQVTVAATARARSANVAAGGSGPAPQRCKLVPPRVPDLPWLPWLHPWLDNAVAPPSSGTEAEAAQPPPQHTAQLAPTKAGLPTDRLTKHRSHHAQRFNEATTPPHHAQRLHGEQNIDRRTPLNASPPQQSRPLPAPAVPRALGRRTVRTAKLPCEQRHRNPDRTNANYSAHIQTGRSFCAVGITSPDVSVATFTPQTDIFPNELTDDAPLKPTGEIMRVPSPSISWVCAESVPTRSVSPSPTPSYHGGSVSPTPSALLAQNPLLQYPSAVRRATGIPREAARAVPAARPESRVSRGIPRRSRGPAPHGLRIHSEPASQRPCARAPGSGAGASDEASVPWHW